MTIAFVALASLFHCLPAGAAAQKYPPNSKGNPLAPTFADVPYGEHEQNKLDFWQAGSEAPTPVVMILHGGGWIAGSKANVSRNPSFPNLRAILGEGISVVAIDYRLIGKHTEGVTPPVKATLHDAARALQFVRSKAREWNIDKERIGSYGPSAGGCSSLWLAYHDDMADPQSEDPVARESTRLWCAAGSGAQTTLDPKQMKEWFLNPGYGGHAFGKYEYGRDFAEFLADREKLLPWIVEYSPFALVSAGDPPVYLAYGGKPPAQGLGPDSIHGVTFGIGLQKRCAELGVECHVVYPGAENVKYQTPTDYLVATLKAPAGAAELKLGSLFQEQAARVEAAVKANPGPAAAYEQAMREYLSRVGVNAGAVIPGEEQEFIMPDLSDAKWAPTTLPHQVPNGITWFAREVELPEALRGKDLTVDVGRVYREESTYWNGVKVGSKRFYGDPSVHTVPASLTKGVRNEWHENKRDFGEDTGKMPALLEEPAAYSRAIRARNTLSVRAAGIRGGDMSGEQSITGPDGQSRPLSADGWKYHVYASEPVLPKELACGAPYGGL